MLKPDSLEAGIRDDILKEIMNCGCELVLSKKLTLNLNQIESIYSNFEDQKAKTAVLAFFISKPTEHLVFCGDEGLHDLILDIKGSMVNKTGIRGKYVSRERMTRDELISIVDGVLPKAKESVEHIDFDFFGIDILHSADDQDESCRAICSVFDEQDWSNNDILSDILSNRG